jgi:hypothetical protein
MTRFAPLLALLMVALAGCSPRPIGSTGPTACDNLRPVLDDRLTACSETLALLSH